MNEANKENIDPCKPCLISGAPCEQCMFGYKPIEERTTLLEKVVKENRYEGIVNRYNLIHKK